MRCLSTSGHAYGPGDGPTGLLQAVEIACSAAPTSRKSASTPQPTTEPFLSRLCHHESTVVWRLASCARLRFWPLSRLVFSFFLSRRTRRFSGPSCPPPHIAGPGTRALEVLWHWVVNAPSARKGRACVVRDNS